MGSALSTTLLLGLFAVVALRPPIPRHASPYNLQFALGWWINEAPQIALWWLVAGTIDTVIHPQPTVWWGLVAALIVVDLVLFSWLVVRARSARPALTRGLQEVFGSRGEPRYTHPAWWRLLVPVISWRPDVRRIRNRRYGPARFGNRLDVYVSRRAGGGTASAPVLVYFHGGLANKMLGSRALIYRFAARGWVCVSASRRQFRGGRRGELDDTRAALAWVHDNAAAYGGNPDKILATGGSAGAGLASAAALTGSHVAAVVALYGYFGDFGGAAGYTPAQQLIHADAPPFFIVHGAVDTLVPRREARAVAARLRAVSKQPVAYAELPGAQHSFDVFSSIRFHAVTDAILRFAELTLGADAHSPTRPHPTSKEGADEPKSRSHR